MPPESKAGDRLPRRNGSLVHPSPYIDSSHAPVYVLQVDGKVFARSVEPLERHIADSMRFYAELDHRYAFVTVLSELRELGAKSRKLYGEHVNAIEPYAKRYCAARAVVVDNALQRGFATAVLWFLRTRIEPLLHRPRRRCGVGEKHDRRVAYC